MGQAESHQGILEDWGCCGHDDVGNSRRLLIPARSMDGADKSNPAPTSVPRIVHANENAARQNAAQDKKEAEELLGAEFDPKLLKESIHTLQSGLPAILIKPGQTQTMLRHIDVQAAPSFPPHSIVFANSAFAKAMQQSKKALQGKPLRQIFGPATSLVEQMRLALHIQDHRVLEGMKIIVYTAREKATQVTLTCRPLKGWTGEFQLFLLTFKPDKKLPPEPLLNYWMNKNKFASNERAFDFELSQSMAQKYESQGKLLERVAGRNRADLEATQRERSTRDPIQSQLPQSMMAVLKGAGSERVIETKTQRKMHMMESSKVRTQPIDTNVNIEGADGVLRPFTGLPYADEASCLEAAKAVMTKRARRDLELAEQARLNHEIEEGEYRRVKDAVRL